MHFSFYTEKVSGEGEDCEPLLVVGQDRSIVGVFDGMGGAGGTLYDTPAGRHTGAWFASRAAADVVAGHLPELLGGSVEVDGVRVATELQERLHAALARRLAEFGAAKSGLRSKLLRALPTTMAVAFVVRVGSAAPGWVTHCFWAGDSRVYAIDPKAGASQLTADDLRSSHDALENLVDDSVMDNCISADTDFRINYRRLQLAEPFALVAATDGCFGYVASPMHFEHLVLTHLDAATSVDGWRVGLRTAIEEVAGDDATMALLAVGGDFAAVQSSFRPRLAELRRTYIQPLDEIEEQTRTTVARADELRQQRLALRSELWARYKPDYERFLADLTKPAAGEPAPKPAAGEPAAVAPATSVAAAPPTDADGAVPAAAEVVPDVPEPPANKNSEGSAP